MHDMTNKDLTVAFAGESQAHMKYLIFSDVAAKEGKKNVARLFKAISYAEQVHATNHYRTMGEIKSTSENLQAGIDGEHYEVNEMYPAYMAVSQFQEEKDATRTFHGALEAEKIHEVMYSDAKKVVDGGEDIQIGKIYICSICGYTTTNQVPEKCPICGAPRSKFVEF